MSDNPFDRFDLDPLASSQEITERMKELLEDAPEAERPAIRDAWELLTRHPRTRARAALHTFSGSARPRVPRALPPEAAVTPGSVAPSAASERPSLESLLGDAEAPARGLALHDDPLLRELSHPRSQS